jgi:predicted regulator of Ras-like GTPase activity (Roadblock/LC7/MglB family)
MTPFGRILRRAIEQTPGAVGCAFAAADGEMVDAYTEGDSEQWAIVTAHYGVVLRHLESAFGTWHFGSTRFFIAQHEKLDVVVYTVAGGYFALLACRPPAPLSRALAALEIAAQQLAQEMR